MKVDDRLFAFDFVLEDERGNSDATTWVLRGLPYDLQVSLQARMSSTMKVPGKALSGKRGDFKKVLANTDVEMQVGGGQRDLEFEILKHGFVGVHNLYVKDYSRMTEKAQQWVDETSLEVSFPAEASDNNKKDWFASFVPPSVRITLANEITGESDMSEDEQKN